MKSIRQAHNSDLNIFSPVLEQFIPEGVDLWVIYQWEYRQIMSQSDVYKRFKYFLNYMFETFDDRSWTENSFKDKEFKVNSLKIDQIVNYFMDNFHFSGSSFGGLKSSFLSHFECIYDGETTQEYKFTTQDIIDIAEALAWASHGDADYHERWDLLGLKERRKIRSNE